MRRVFLLGSNGNVGSQVLEVIHSNPEQLELYGCSVSINDQDNFLIIKQFSPKIVILRKFQQLKIYRRRWPTIKFFLGIKQLKKILPLISQDILIFNALSGVAGIEPTILAIKNGFHQALVNKEGYVAKGALINKLLKIYQTKIIPVDSEISSLFQLKENILPGELIQTWGITASGGALRDKTAQEIQQISVAGLLNHPTWKMGAKITIDSASLLNKAFEVIEAAHYFELDISQIEVKVERTSHIHAYLKTNLGYHYYIDEPDMKNHIYYALCYPKVDKTANIKTHPQGYRLDNLDTTNFPLYDFCLQTYRKKPQKMLKLIKLSQKGVKLLISGRISYDQYLGWVMKKAK
ncbi:MAG: hypothetical protein LBV55_03395 [Acholeplasmatales bacterium]|jgi:1-deoxy-D-xylulose-5-phosphate reductoisomerase|nr:hypothetical protein [Acholeplasmatales bacterium]